MENYFYEDEKKEKIKVCLLESTAKEWAKKFNKPKFPKNKGEKNPPLSSSQLRKFHFEVKALEERLKNEIKTQEEKLKAAVNPDDVFVKLRPLVKMIKAKVAYVCRTPNSKDRKVPEEFKQYIDDIIGKIEDYKDFKAFALSFEAVVGYFYGEGGR
ncbi:MAG: type III-A CRISPR-associated protein Csm2 [Candidatus Brocadia sp.]|nr:type III-A CRISPR-associated protein Csm2 [Candidatus Brocadia sp.]